ncbi:MAG: PglZ domain-containing protein [Pirellulaceae bacterium]
MKIKDYVANHILLPRLEKFEVLVVYDADKRYRQLCQEVASDVITVVDATEGSIPARELASKTLQDLGKRTGAKKRLLIYVPVGPPKSNTEKIQDPFSVYGEIGDSFPRTAGDSFEQICLKAKAEQATEIRKVFTEHPKPSFELIDNIGGGAGWPALQAVLGVQSAREILLQLLKPNAMQLDKLSSDASWISEAKEFLRRNLGIELKTQIQEHSAVQAELWRLLLFSEFVCDLPESTGIPASLASVPRAIPEAMPLVYSVCESLRDQNTTQAAYIEMATKVEADLNLKVACSSIPDLGIRDTFPFEERSFFANCLAAIDKDDVDLCRHILARNQKSVWTGLGESQVQWSLIASIVGLIEACADAERELAKYTASQEKLVYYYLDQFFKVDLRYREFETAVFSTIDIDPQLQPAIQRARKTYLILASQVQKIFVKHLETSGWPPANMLSSTEIFDKLVAPTLAESGRKVAYFLIDALRYELGTELERELSDEGDISLTASFSVIPTVTPIGMTSLMPGAQSLLRIAKKADSVVPMLGDKEIKTVAQHGLDQEQVRPTIP